MKRFLVVAVMSVAVVQTLDSAARADTVLYDIPNSGNVQHMWTPGNDALVSRPHSCPNPEH